MSSSKDTKLIPLFGRLDDERSKFFVSLLRESADKKRGTGKYIRMQTSRNVGGVGAATHLYGNIYIISLTTQFKNESFLPRNGVDHEISDEWVRYFTDVIARTYNKKFDKDTKLGREIINLIESVSGIASPGSEKEFTQEIIKILVRTMTKTAGAPAPPFDIGNPSTWENIETVTYNNDTLKYLLKAPDAQYNPTNIPFANGHNTLASLGNEFTDCYTKIDIKLNAGGIGALDSLKTTFGYNYNKYFIRKMLEEHAKTAKQPINNSTSSFFDDVSIVQEKYFRRGDRLLYNDDKGNEVEVDRNSKAYAELHNDPNKCLDTGFKDNDTQNERCSDYLRDCLLGKNIDKCKTFLQKPDYWTNVQDEIDNMLPVTAYDTLRSFQFDFISVHDNKFGRKLNKVSSVEKWIEKLHVLSKTQKPKEALVDEIVKAARNNASAVPNSTYTSINAAGLAARQALVNGVDYNVALQAGVDASQYIIDIINRVGNTAEATARATHAVRAPRLNNTASAASNAAINAALTVLNNLTNRYSVATIEAKANAAGVEAARVYLDRRGAGTLIPESLRLAGVAAAAAATAARAAGGTPLETEAVDIAVRDAQAKLVTESGSPQILTLGEVNKISSNTKLIEYLKMLVTKINSNPAILNPDYVNPNVNPKSSQINSSDSFVDSQLAKKGVKPKLSVPNDKLSISLIDKLENTIFHDRQNFNVRFKIGSMPVSVPFKMYGGNGDNSNNNAVIDKLSDENKRSSKILIAHHASIVSRLKKFGKKIDPSDDKKIQELIENLHKSEEKLYTASLYAEKYAQLLELHGEKDEESILTYKHLDDFIKHRNKLFNRVSKKQDDLLSVMKALIEVAVKEELQSKPTPENEKILDHNLIDGLLG